VWRIPGRGGDVFSRAISTNRSFSVLGAGLCLREYNTQITIWRSPRSRSGNSGECMLMPPRGVIVRRGTHARCPLCTVSSMSPIHRWSHQSTYADSSKKCPRYRRILTESRRACARVATRSRWYTSAPRHRFAATKPRERTSRETGSKSGIVATKPEPGDPEA